MEDRFASTVGIRPSPEWLDACREYLRGRNRRGSNIDTPSTSQSHEEEDEILYQIINTDLRNVVRRLDGNSVRIGNGNGIGGGSINAMSTSVMLRKAIQDSLPSSSSSSSSSTSTSHNHNNHTSNDTLTSSGKVILPESFRCMIQIEELLDVSMNAETRLSLGPASRNAPAPIGNQNKRCLKMAVSDGYYDNGGDVNVMSSSDGNLNMDLNLYRGHIVAMEMEPIPDLSVHSKPGIKIIISGPITVRLGVLLLHSGNTMVCGGCIPDLIPVQRKAIELAAKVAGVGIDPTVRALVWNPDEGMEEEENDEGEQASGDITGPRSGTDPGPDLGLGSESVNHRNVLNQNQQPPSTNHTRNIPQDATMMDNSLSSTINGGRRAPISMSSSERSVMTPATRRNAHSNSNSSTTATSTSTGTGTGTVRINPYSQHSAQNNTSTSMSISSSNRPTSSGGGRSLQNPYSTNSSSSLSSSINTSTLTATSTPHAPIQNPYQRSRGKSSTSKQSANTNTSTNSSNGSVTTTPINTYQNGFTTASAMAASGSNGSNIGSNSITPSNNATTRRLGRSSSLNPYSSTKKTPTTTASLKRSYSATQHAQTTPTPTNNNVVGSTTSSSMMKNPYKSGNTPHTHSNNQRNTNVVSVSSSSSSSSSSTNTTSTTTSATKRQNISSTKNIQNQTKSYQLSNRCDPGGDNNEQSLEQFVDLTSTSPDKDSLTPTNPDSSQQSSSSSANTNANANTSAPTSSSTSCTFQTIQNLSPTSTALSEPLSFKELRHLLKRIIHNPDEYEKYENKVFVVPCKMHAKQIANNLGFTIEKNKDYKKTKKKSSDGSKPEKVSAV